jgi:hypothetical protein
MADLLQQLQPNPSVGLGCGGACLQKLQISAACFGGVSLKAIPASLLLTNYIADVGDRAQQCLGTVKRYGEARMRACSECLALLQEVKGLLQLSVQPVLLQLLGGQRLQELVEGLMRCKQLLGDTYMRL